MCPSGGSAPAVSYVTGGNSAGGNSVARYFVARYFAGGSTRSAKSMKMPQYCLSTRWGALRT